MSRRTKSDVKLVVPDPNYPSLQKTVGLLAEEFHVEATQSSRAGEYAITFNGVNGHDLDRFTKKLDRHFGSPRFSYEVVDPTKPPML
ncbi:MAG: hypothetical protein H6867_06140 [Rhodospirillales bacterium]|nr:hypothetical protein [Rhodospirillales bacterium]MCB9995109.1 hypothetical protein [Rhodospirillales bacterium]